MRIKSPFAEILLAIFACRTVARLFYEKMLQCSSFYLLFSALVRNGGVFRKLRKSLESKILEKNNKFSEKFFSRTVVVVVTFSKFLSVRLFLQWSEDEKTQMTVSFIY